MRIKAPYNFVPLYPSVFFPLWAEQVSQDIPFSDSESGEIIVQLEAETPVYVRNGVKDSDLPGYKEFSHYEYLDEKGLLQKKYFIPGTTIKGMIRNVLEIMSFGKMGRINDTRYAFRDLNSCQYDLKSDQKNIHCGWLVRNEKGKYTIQDGGEPVWIQHDEIDKKFNLDKKGFVEAFKDGGFATDSRNARMLRPECKTAEYKYNELLAGKELFISYKKKKIDNKQYYTEGKEKGILVVTGQPMVRKYNSRKGKWEGKFREFVFPVYNSKIVRKVISDKLWEEFLFQYADHDSQKISKDWKFWKNKLLKNKPVPIFFRVKEKDNSEIKDFGLTFLYKLPFNNTVKDLLEPEHKREDYDLGEVMFGTISSGKILKGRVQFGHAEVCGIPVVLDEVSGILGTPRASYYPIYLEQKGEDGLLVPAEKEKYKGRYLTYMDQARLAGWKRYAMRRIVRLPAERSNMGVRFKPLAGGTKFEFKIRFHNLRMFEIGALLSAITFHNTDHTWHNLGMAKPYGYGRVKLTPNVSGLKCPQKDYMGSFEALMDAEFFGKKRQWIESEQISELLKMASIIRSDEQAVYMTLSEHSTIKGSEETANSSQYLERTGKLYSNYHLLIKSLEKENVFAEYQRQYHENLKRREEVVQEQLYLEEMKWKEEEKRKEEERLVQLNLEKMDRIAEEKWIKEESQKQLLENLRLKKIALIEKTQERELLFDRGLSFLDNIETLDKLGNRITDWLKKNRQDRIPEQDYDILEKRLRIWYTHAMKKPRDLKDFRKFFEFKLSKWVNPESYGKWKDEFFNLK